MFNGCLSSNELNPMVLLPPINQDSPSPIVAPIPSQFDSPEVAVGGISVKVDEPDLWQAFYNCGTEMIINRGGRRMFPCASLSVQGLEPDRMYKVLLDIIPADRRRYKFINNHWTPVGKADPEVTRHPVEHPDSVSLGSYWRQTRVNFSKVKITNSREAVAGNIVLHSMHKYMTCVHILALDAQEPRKATAHWILPLPLTSFIAVTAYQNERITQMKIRSNPFAKAFRDAETVSLLQSKHIALSRRMLQHVQQQMGQFIPLDVMYGGRNIYKTNKYSSDRSMTSLHVDRPVMPLVPPAVISTSIAGQYSMIQPSTAFFNQYLPHPMNPPFYQWHTNPATINNHGLLTTSTHNEISAQIMTGKGGLTLSNLSADESADDQPRRKIMRVMADDDSNDCSVPMSAFTSTTLTR